MQQAGIQRAQLAAAGEAGAAAGFEHRAGALLHGGETFEAGAPEHAGVGQGGHDRQQSIEASVLLASAHRAAACQLRQAVGDHGGEAELGFFPCAPGAVATGDLGTMAVGVWCRAVIDQRDARRAQGDGVGILALGLEGHGRHQQAQSPDGATVSVDAPGGSQHRGLAFTADAAQGFAQRLADFAVFQRRLGHLLEAGPEGQRRGVHQAQVQIAVGATTATVHQRRFG
ncbi:hypothetical protein D3C84_462980 [compost metagenome]